MLQNRAPQENISAVRRRGRAGRSESSESATAGSDSSESNNRSGGDRTVSSATTARDCSVCDCSRNSNESTLSGDGDVSFVKQRSAAGGPGKENAAPERAADRTDRPAGPTQFRHSLSCRNASSSSRTAPLTTILLSKQEKQTESDDGLLRLRAALPEFFYRHEIPRKALHVSVGFITAKLYTSGVQLSQVAPALMALLVPISIVDVLRHRSARFNKLYVRVLGPMMRESEVNKYNGVIFFLAGAWAVSRFCPKDIGALSIMLLSWCDTAASTFGRLFGKYTPKVRQGKSLAGSLAALLTGAATAALFWGWIAPVLGPGPAYDSGENAFAFQGQLHFPVPEGLAWVFAAGSAAVGEGAAAEGASVAAAASASWWSFDAVRSALTLSGGAAVGVASLWAGLVASASEAVDIFGLDDNLTIPVLCGVGLWGFMKAFG